MLDYFIKLIPFAVMNVATDKQFEDFMDCTLPYQILKLVRQAQRYESFETDPHISVGADMRQKLMHPLTLEEAKAIGGNEYMVEEENIRYELESHAYVKDVHCATVSVNIDYCDKQNGIDVHYHDVKLYIKCAGNRKRMGLEIISVEHN